MKLTWKRTLSLASLVLLVLLVWLLWPDRRFAQAKALQKELSGAASKSLTSEQRRDKWQQYRKLTEKLSPAQRDQLSAESRKRRNQEMAKYFAMSKADKTRHLDDRIRASEKMRQQMQAKGGQGGAGQRPGAPKGGPGGTGAGKDRSVAGRDHGRQDRLDSSTPAERAMFAQYRKDLDARRKQMGLPPAGPRR